MGHPSVTHIPYYSQTAANTPDQIHSVHTTTHESGPGSPLHRETPLIHAFLPAFYRSRMAPARQLPQDSYIPVPLLSRSFSGSDNAFPGSWHLKPHFSDKTQRYHIMISDHSRRIPLSLTGYFRLSGAGSLPLRHSLSCFSGNR